MNSHEKEDLRQKLLDEVIHGNMPMKKAEEIYRKAELDSKPNYGDIYSWGPMAEYKKYLGGVDQQFFPPTTQPAKQTNRKLLLLCN